MAKPSTQFVCQNCGTVHARWAGKCEGCGEWNTLFEEGGDRPGPLGRKPSKGRLFALETLAGGSEDAREELMRERHVFIGQVSAGWAWANQP